MSVHVLAQHIASSLVIFRQPFGQPPKILPLHAGEDQQVGRSAFHSMRHVLSVAVPLTRSSSSGFSSDATGCHRRCLGEKDSKGHPNTATHCTLCSSRLHAMRVTKHDRIHAPRSCRLSERVPNKLDTEEHRQLHRWFAYRSPREWLSVHDRPEWLPEWPQ